MCVLKVMERLQDLQDALQDFLDLQDFWSFTRSIKMKLYQRLTKRIHSRYL